MFLRWEWRRNGKTVRAVRAVDTATHPDWRGKGIFSRLTRTLADQMREEGVDFIFNTPNRLSRPGYLKMGWASVGRGTVWARSTGLPRSSEPEFPGAYDLVRDPELGPWLSRRAETDGRYLTRRSLEYLAWRYSEVPGFQYHAAWNLRGDEGAILLFRIKKSGMVHETRFCEVLLGNGKRSIALAAELLRTVSTRAPLGVATAMAGEGDAGWKTLLQAGFLPVPRSGPILTARPLQADPPHHDCLQRKSWRPSIGDLELF